MILMRNLAVVACLLAVTACSSINSAKVGELNIENGTSYSGQVVKIDQTKLSANFSKRLTGATIGHFIAVGMGANSSLKFVSAMAGVAIANKEYGQVVDLIEVQSTDGKSYQTLVPQGYFSLNEQVDFIAEKTTIHSIVRSKEKSRFEDNG